MIGGNNDDNFLSEGEKFDLKKNEWSPIQMMQTPRSRASAVILQNKIYVFGGFKCRNKKFCICKEKE